MVWGFARNVEGIKLPAIQVPAMPNLELWAGARPPCAEVRLRETGSTRPTFYIIYIGFYMILSYLSASFSIRL